jgi:hypothetical protein
VAGQIHMLVTVREDMREGLICVPHGWWLPEEKDLWAFENNDGIILFEFF